MRTIQSITTKLGSYIPLVMLITWLDFGGILLESPFLPNFLWKFWMCFFKVKHSIGHISGMVGPIDVKRKGGAVWNSLIWGICWGGGGWLTWNEMDVSRSFVTVTIWVTMVGWVDIPHSDWGDFRCWRAVDISSFRLRGCYSSLSVQ